MRDMHLFADGGSSAVNNVDPISFYVHTHTPS